MLDVFATVEGHSNEGNPSVQHTFLGFVRCADGFSIRLDGPQHNGLLSDLSVVLMESFGLNLAGPLCQEVRCADVCCGEGLLYYIQFFPDF